MVAVAWSLVSCSGGSSDGKVIFLGIDGLDPLAIDLLMSEGKLPNFARLRQDGAYGRLISQKPILSPIIWTTIATGKTPGQHGIGHFVAVDPQTGEKLPVTSDLRRVEALWNIAAKADRRPVVVGWWATWPPETLDGLIVSDHTAYHFLFEEGFTGAATQQETTHPPELEAEIAPLLRRPTDLTYEEITPFVDVSPDAFSQPFDLADDLGHFKWALATAKSYRDIGLELWRQEQPALEMVYIEGVDTTSHLFGHLFRVEGLVGELAEQQEKFGRTVEQMYRFADELVGRYLEAMDDDTTLIVASDHGFRLGELHDDPSRLRDMRRVSERFHRMEGILYLYGRGVKRHSRIDKPVLVDLAPTVLALLGLPAAEDMPGRVLSEALEFPVLPDRIASHETGERGEQKGVVRDAEVDQAVIERLEALGYLGGVQSSEGERNLAAIAFEEGRYDDALAIYQRLIEAEPEEPGLRTSLAGALGAMGDYEGALEQLEAALTLDPLNVEAYHNRAVIHERQGHPGLAIADYNTVLRYAPDYEPSRAALLRLTGSASANAPSSDAEQQASFLAEKASQAARRGDYETALSLLDHAEAIAPQYSLVFQYRSNVAYLMGDRDKAIAALERALELEPDNALFRENLRRLKESPTDQ
jgi:predicted AlkP superfamily phosphohydrolase/phosphomutase/Flp pilus assembly protein TadD